MTFSCCAKGCSACVKAAALATLEIFETDDVLVNNRLKAAAFTQALQPLAQHEKVINFRQQGMIWAFDAVLDDAAASSFSRRFFSAALENEILLRPIGKTVYLMPPYILNQEEISNLGHGVLQVFNQVLKQ